MVGKLLLNSRYLIFHIYDPSYSGVLQTPRLVSTGRVLSIALGSIIDSAVESGVRAKSSRPNWKNRDDFVKKSNGDRMINRHPGLFDDTETYSRLVLTIETGDAVEIASFEVQDPHAWLGAVRSKGAKSAG